MIWNPVHLDPTKEQIKMPTNPHTYELFKRILREAPRADKYCADYKVSYEYGPNAGKTRTFWRDFSDDEFDDLPWDEFDAIGSAEWKPKDALPAPGKADFVAIGLTHDGGIAVTNCFVDFGSHAVGLAGVMPGNRSDIDLNDPRVMNRHVCKTDDEVVAKVLELIALRDWPDDTDDGYSYDDSRYDPLDERNYPPYMR